MSTPIDNLRIIQTQAWDRLRHLHCKESEEPLLKLLLFLSKQFVHERQTNLLVYGNKQFKTEDQTCGTFYCKEPVTVYFSHRRLSF